MMTSAPREQGAVLLICLVFMLVITTLVFAGSQRLALDVRLHGVLDRERQLSQIARTTLADVERRLAGMSQPVQPCRPGQNLSVCLSDMEAGESFAFDHAWIFKEVQPVPGYSVYWYLSAIPDEENILMQSRVRAYQLDVQVVGDGESVDLRCDNRRRCLREIIVQYVAEAQ